MKKSKILNKSVHNQVDTSADVSIGFAKREDVVKHIKIQGSRKRSNPINSVIPRFNNALMPKYEAKANYSSFWSTLVNPFILNQFQWERGMFCTASEVSVVRDYGLDLSKGCLPLKKTDTDGVFSTGTPACFAHKEPLTHKLATVGASTITSGATNIALSKYSGAEHYSELYANLPDVEGVAKHKRQSLRCATNNLDVPGGRQGVQVFWLNDKHTRRERQAKALNLGHSIQRDVRNGISLNHTGSYPLDDAVYRDLNYPDFTTTTDVKFNDNPQYDLEHDMMELTYTNTSNTAVYLEFVEYEPQQGSTGPLEYYNECVNEWQGNFALSNYDLNTPAENNVKPSLLTPLPNNYVNTSGTIDRGSMSRLSEIQFGDKASLDVLGSVAKDSEGLGRLGRASISPSINQMVMTSADTVHTVSGSASNTQYPFVDNPLPTLAPVTQTLQSTEGEPTKFGARLLSHHAAAVPGCFVHQTVDDKGAMWHLDQLGTAASGQAVHGLHGANQAGVSSWRPVNMMNLSPTQNPNMDLHVTFERGQDCDSLVTTEDQHKFIDRDGKTTNSATSTVDGVTYNNQKLVYKDTQRECIATRTEDTDARLLMPNYANEWIKLWREDLYDAENKTKNKNTKRPYGNAVNTEQSALRQASVYDQIGDKWLVAGERPTGRSFTEKYRQRKKTRVMVEPRSMITYQFFADPGIEGDSRLLKSDLVKENNYGLTQVVSAIDGTIAADINTVLNAPPEEFHEKVMNQHEFFDQRSRCCMVFVNGAPHMIDGKHTTNPASINYTMKTLEKLAYVPKFYNKMQRLTHSIEYPVGKDDRFYDSEFKDRDGNSHIDATTYSYARSVSTPAQSAAAKVQADGRFDTSGGIDLTDIMVEEMPHVNIFDRAAVQRSSGTGFATVNVGEAIDAFIDGSEYAAEKLERGTNSLMSISKSTQMLLLLGFAGYNYVKAKT